jgi:hypothetical protein
MIRQIRDGEATLGAKQSNNVARWLVMERESNGTTTIDDNLGVEGDPGPLRSRTFSHP